MWARDGACFSSTFRAVSRPLAWCVIRLCIQYTAGAASMAGAWSIHWPVRPVRGLYGPLDLRQSSVASRGFQTYQTNMSVTRQFIRYIVSDA